jgi:glycosyltransferase involved in cell wall biosynthesis
LSVRWVCGRQTTAKEVLAAIEARIPGIRILSPGARGEPNFAGAKYQRALESAAVGLNLSRRNDIYLYTSDRLAHMAGNGLAVMLEAANGYQQFVPEGEFVYFRDFDEMIEKLRRLIAEPDYRQAVAAAGRSRYHDLFNEQVVARYLVDVAFDRLDPAAYPWPTLHAF